MQENYTSKKEIYEDANPIALKFIPSFPVRDKQNYSDLFNSLELEVGGKINKFSENVANINSADGQSFAYFWKLTSDKGELSYVVLSHETGLEVFVPMLLYSLAVGTGGYIGKKVVEKIGDKLLDKAIDTSIDKLIHFLKKMWSPIIDPPLPQDAPRKERYKIIEVEIRTLDKGIMFIDFADFNEQQLICLLSQLNNVNHISQCNSTCFNGKLRPVSNVRW